MEWAGKHEELRVLKIQLPTAVSRLAFGFRNGEFLSFLYISDIL